MASNSKFYTDDTGKHQQVLESLQKSGTLNKNTVVHIVQEKGPKDNHETSSKSALTVASEDRKVTLSDGTQIIIDSINEYILVGPKGTRIVISCLPLFLLPELPRGPPAIDESIETITGSVMTVRAINESMIETLKESDTPSDDGHNQLTTDTILEPLPNLADVFTQSSTNDVFDYLDPFDSNSHIANSFSENFEESVRDKAISNAYMEALKGTIDIEDSDDNEVDDEDDIENPPLLVNYVDQLSFKDRASSVSFVKKSQLLKSASVSTSLTPLPPSPLTLLPRYQEKGGWLIKLSFQKGVFGDKWQKRYFILNGPKLSYFKKYGDSKPRGTITLPPGTWCKTITPGSPRMNDAVSRSGKTSIISVNRCLAVHRPNNYAASLCSLLASEDVVDAFSSLTVSLSNPTDSSRTFYMIAPSEQERHSWVDAITNNIQAYSRSQDALDVACQELQCMLSAVGSTIKDRKELSSILVLLHTKRQSIAKSIT